MLQAFMAALFGGSADVVNKILLGRMKIAIKDYLPLIFIILTITSLLFVPFNFNFEADKVFSLNYILVFILMIISAGAWNILLSKSMQVEPLHEYEAIVMISPLFTIIMAEVFLPVERSLVVFVAGLVASIVLVASRIRKDHLVISHAAKRTLLAVLFIAIESICIKYLLGAFSPSLLYSSRVFVLAIAFLIIYKPDFRLLKNFSVLRMLILASLMGCGVMILKYYAFQRIGLAVTTIILLFAPLVTYFASYYYFNEKRNFKKDLICAIIILFCVIASLVYK